jgi:hypothetical protein
MIRDLVAAVLLLAATSPAVVQGFSPPAPMPSTPAPAAPAPPPFGGSAPPAEFPGFSPPAGAGRLSRPGRTMPTS